MDANAYKEPGELNPRCRRPHDGGGEKGKEWSPENK